MNNRGRKKKIDIALIDDKIDDIEYLDNAQKSVKEQCLIWECDNLQNKRKEIYCYPLSYKSAINYWEGILNTPNNKNAKSTLSRIRKGSFSRDRERYIYDLYSKQTKLINELVYATSSLCTLKNSLQRTGSNYAYALTTLMHFLVDSFKDINTINDITEDKQTIIYNELSSSNSEYFINASLNSTIKRILIYSLQKNNLSSAQLENKLIKPSHSRINSKLDYPQEVSLQLLAIVSAEIIKIKDKQKEYLIWKDKYKGKTFDSIENIAKAYLTIPKEFKNTPFQKSSITRYRSFYDSLSLHLYGNKLSELPHNKIIELAKSGQNIDDLSNPEIMSWFIDDILINYPYDIKYKQSTNLTDMSLSEYTRWNTNRSLKCFLFDRGTNRDSDFTAVFNDIMSRKYPTAQEIIPFALYWILQTGSNPEAITNMRRKEKGILGIVHIGELSPLGDTPVINSFKNRGTKNWYWFVLNKNEKHGLYDHFIFLKSYLSRLWEKHDLLITDDQWPFWIYRGTSPLDKINTLTSINFKYQLPLFMQNHKILLDDGQILDKLHLSRLRNTFITTADLNGASVDEIQEWIRHDTFDTRFQYYDNSPEQRDRNFRSINAIQEDIIEKARSFKGQTSKESYNINLSKKNVIPTYLAGCSDNTKPLYNGAKKIPKNHICIDWDMCLFCPHSRVFLEHLPRICARITEYASFRKTMHTDEWENNFGAKHTVAMDALQRWLDDGGDQEDIINAWNISKAGEIILPPIFPTGHIALKGNEHVA